MYAGCVSGAIQKSDYLGLIEKTGFVNITLQKDREIVLPDSILAEYISVEEIEAYRKGNLGIYSITVYADKPSPATAEIQIRSAKPADKDAVVGFLQSVGLPTEDLNPELANFLLAFVDGQLVGTAGVEITGEIGLLRSVAVKESFRNFKIAQRLVNDVTKQMRLQWVKELYLITTTAEAYFAKQGFEKVERDSVPAEIAQSQQFSGLCPSSATVMKKSVEKTKIKLLDLEQASDCCTPGSGCC